MKESYILHKGFLSPQIRERMFRGLEEYKDCFRLIERNKYGMNLPYMYFDGVDVRKKMPDLMDVIRDKVHPIAEKLTGQKLRLMDDDMRNVRFVKYRGNTEGIYWHIDSGYYTALITLKNTTGGGVQIFNQGLSRFLRIPVYLLYFWQGLFTLFKPIFIKTAPGDMLFIAGGTAVHRGYNANPDGERLIFCVSFDPMDKKQSWLRKLALKYANVTVKIVNQKKDFQHAPKH